MIHVARQSRTISMLFVVAQSTAAFPQLSNFTKLAHLDLTITAGSRQAAPTLTRKSLQNCRQVPWTLIVASRRAGIAARRERQNGSSYLKKWSPICKMPEDRQGSRRGHALTGLVLAIASSTPRKLSPAMASNNVRRIRHGALRTDQNVNGG